MSKKNEIPADDRDDGFLGERGAGTKVNHAIYRIREAAVSLREAGWEGEASVATMLADDLQGRVLFCCMKSAVDMAGPASIVAARTARRYADIVEQNWKTQKALEEAGEAVV